MGNQNEKKENDPLKKVKDMREGKRNTKRIPTIRENLREHKRKRQGFFRGRKRDREGKEENFVMFDLDGIW